METLVNRGNEKKLKNKINKHHCKFCNFTTSHKNDWSRHLLTAKHKKACGFHRDNSKTQKQHQCSFCGKRFKSRSGKWKHEKKCIENNDCSVGLKCFHNVSKKTQNKNENLEKQELEKLKEELKIADEKIKMLEKEKLQQKVEHLTESLSASRAHIEDLKKQAKNITTQNINTQNNTQNNNYINIQLYLNEKCKNAMLLTDFVKELQFKLTDINPERPASTIESLSKCITDRLQNMEESERPVHCTDAKRLVFHVKDASGWSKDVNNKKIDNAIGWANVRQQGAWIRKAKADDWVNQKDDTSYLNMNVAMGKFSDNPKRAKGKIKRAIAKAVTLKLPSGAPKA